MKLRAIPGSGQEWLLLDEQDYIIATFHGYKMGSDRPQKMAELFAGIESLCEMARPYIECLVEDGECPAIKDVGILDAALTLIRKE